MFEVGGCGNLSIEQLDERQSVLRPVSWLFMGLGAQAMVGCIIRNLEPLLAAGSSDIRAVERIADASLGLAYVISVAFYRRLLASFVLHPLGSSGTPWLANLLTTVIPAAIGITSLLRGLRGLEWMETVAVTIKLGIISALLTGLLWHDAGWLASGTHLALQPAQDGVESLRLLAGMLLLVQGFETSRYLGRDYDAETRVRSMRHAQWLAGAIYVVFVLLTVPLLDLDSNAPSETAIIDITGRVATVLPVILTIAAVMSQLSAAIADTVGAGGMFAEVSGDRIPQQYGYLLVVAAAIGLVWTVDLFGIIAIASRAFAFYYLLQCVAAWLAAGRLRHAGKRRLLRIGFCCLALILALVVIFATPAEAG